jgi:hypothetical protein
VGVEQAGSASPLMRTVGQSRSFAFCSVAPFIEAEDSVRVIIVCSFSVILTLF